MCGFHTLRCSCLHISGNPTLQLPSTLTERLDVPTDTNIRVTADLVADGVTDPELTWNLDKRPKSGRIKSLLASVLRDKNHKQKMNPTDTHTLSTDTQTSSSSSPIASASLSELGSMSSESRELSGDNHDDGASDLNWRQFLGGEQDDARNGANSGVKLSVIEEGDSESNTQETHLSSVSIEQPPCVDNHGDGASLSNWKQFLSGEAGHREDRSEVQNNCNSGAKPLLNEEAQIEPNTRPVQYEATFAAFPKAPERRDMAYNGHNYVHTSPVPHGGQTFPNEYATDVPNALPPNHAMSPVPQAQGASVDREKRDLEHKWTLGVVH